MSTNMTALEGFAAGVGPETGETSHIITFELAGRHLAMQATEVMEVLQPVALSPLPEIGAMAGGALNLRGEVIVVLDLRQLLNVEARLWTRKTRIIIAQNASSKVGLIVDGVSDVIEVPRSDLAPVPQLLLGIDARAVVNMLRTEGRLVPLLSVRKLLQDLPLDRERK